MAVWTDEKIYAFRDALIAAARHLDSKDSTRTVHAAAEIIGNLIIERDALRACVVRQERALMERTEKDDE